ncbi:2-keto-4-pentenoate hydratase [Labrys wisconsinensis]|uniref:2-keto-4-pentenoate hydratase n=1 Tax=Labrys wisconsinensis TaxID=425677 RepID=A0ABU0J8P9_9HYPH|nr:fumarylacetoacetate hydrolase family protein [Labrys wisconsinensis]MDQ0470643.1 2-keto-4-pentenoate hydratase [Labrys wisconsinensis]
MSHALSDGAIERAAMILASARHDHRTVALPPDVRPGTVEEAYAIQDRLAARLGWETGGWFCGCTNEAIQRQLGLSEPYCARVFRHLVFPDAAIVDTAAFPPIVIECEFAFVLGRDLPARPEPYSQAEVEAAVAAVRPAIEVVAGHLEDWQSQPPCSIIADNGVDGALVCGPSTPWPAHDLSRVAVELLVDGRTVQSGTGANVMGNPIHALVWLANAQRRRGYGLRAGHVHNTGTATLMQPVGPGQTAVARFGPLGQVTASFR